MVKTDSQALKVPTVLQAFQVRMLTVEPGMTTNRLVVVTAARAVLEPLAQTLQPAETVALYGSKWLSFEVVLKQIVEAVRVGGVATAVSAVMVVLVVPVDGAMTAKPMLMAAEVAMVA
jgi:hypothetical protein